MAEARIPVDLFNPGQVFACLGFMEAADILCGSVEGGFDWSDPADVRFTLTADGERNPVDTVLAFLAEAEVTAVAPASVDGPWDEARVSMTFPTAMENLRKSDGNGYSSSALPVELNNGKHSLLLSSWLDCAGMEAFKLFAGKQIASQLFENMLSGDRSKKQTQGLKQLVEEIGVENFAAPFDACCVVGGRFGFDSRGGWDALRIGTSLDKQNYFLRLSPIVEILAVIGLQNARPVFRSSYSISYFAWNGVMPLPLCRAFLGSASSLLDTGDYLQFSAHLGDDQQYKKIFPATQEV